MTLRHVEDRDALPFYRWWTHVETTRLYQTPKPGLSWKKHLKWFVENFDNPWWLVGEYGEGERRVAVGAVRIDPGEGSSMVRGDGWISIVVAPEYRGKGLGQELIRAAASHYGARLHARIHELNAPSLRAFEKAGFREIRRDGVWRIYSCD